MSSASDSCAVMCLIMRRTCTHVSLTAIVCQGRELLRAQGIDICDMPAADEFSEQQMTDLAGNAWGARLWYELTSSRLGINVIHHLPRNVW